MNKKELFLHLLREKQISKKKIFNITKNWLAYIKKDVAPKGYPSILMIEPTNLCNLQCPLCPRGADIIKREKGMMAFENFRKIIDEMGDFLLNTTLYAFGEPFMNKDIYKMIEYIKKKRIFVRISTNGHFFSKEEDRKKLIETQLDSLVVALDGASQETFIQYRKKGDFNEVVKNLKQIVHLKKESKSKLPNIELQFIVMKQNEHEIEKVKELAQEIGVDKLTLKSVLLDEATHLSNEEKAKYLPTNPQYSRYVNKERLSKKDEINITHCSRIWFSSLILWDGSVVPCCYDFDGSHIFGNVFKENFRDIWNNERYQSFRKQVLKDKTIYKICESCSGKLLNTTLD